MPTYPFRCPRCGFTTTVFCHSSERTNPRRCPECCGPLTREYNYPFATKFFHEGYNPGLNRHIGSTRQLREELKVRTEEAYINSGVDTTYALSDDPAVFGLDKDRLEWRKAEDDRNRRAKAKAAQAASDGGHA